MNSLVPVRDPQVQREFSISRTLLDELFKDVEALEMRLQSVTVPEEPPLNDGIKPTEILVPLAAQMKEFNEMLARLKGKLTSLRNRIEL